MAGLLEMMERISFIKDNVEQIAEKSLNDCAPKIIELQVQQLESGIDANGEPIKRQNASYYPYTKQYERRKAKLGLQTNVVDLKLTGDYYSGLKAHASDGVLTIKSDDPKAPFLDERTVNGVTQKTYDRDKINGLTDVHVHELIEEDLDPATLINVKEILKL